MTIVKIGIIAVVGVILCAIVKSNTPAYSTLIGAGIVIIILISIVPDVKQLLSAIDSIQLTDEFSTKGIGVMLKVFSILLVGSVCSDICRDNGEGAVAGVVELSAKLTAIACALPVLTAVVSLATSFLRGP